MEPRARTMLTHPLLSALTATGWNMGQMWSRNVIWSGQSGLKRSLDYLLAALWWHLKAHQIPSHDPDWIPHLWFYCNIDGAVRNYVISGSLKKTMPLYSILSTDSRYNRLTTLGDRHVSHDYMMTSLNETFTALLAIREGNPRRPVTRSFLWCAPEQMIEQSVDCDLTRHCVHSDVTVMVRH